MTEAKRLLQQFHAKSVRRIEASITRLESRQHDEQDWKTECRRSADIERLRQRAEMHRDFVELVKRMEVPK